MAYARYPSPPCPRRSPAAPWRSQAVRTGQHSAAEYIPSAVVHNDGMTQHQHTRRSSAPSCRVQSAFAAAGQVRVIRHRFTAILLSPSPRTYTTTRLFLRFCRDLRFQQSIGHFEVTAESSPVERSMTVLQQRRACAGS